MKIINLHNHSHYSALDSIATPKDYVDKSIEQGVNSVAITDHGNMNNWGNFYLYAKSKNFKPIFGCEFYTLNSLDDWNKTYDNYENTKKDLEKKTKEEIKKVLNVRNHLILLVKNQVGFKNINLLIHEAYKNFYYKPRIDKKLIEKYHEGLICSSACLAGEIQQYVLQDNIEKASEVIEWYKNLFKDDFYIEIQFNELKEQSACNLKMIELAKKHNVKAILTSDSHYINKEDQETHQTLLLLQSKATLTDLEKGEGWSFEAKNLYLKDYDQHWMDCQRFNFEVDKKQFDELCTNTLEVDSKIENFEIDRHIKLKDTEPEILDKDEHLKELCYESLNQKKLDDNYKKRLDFELDIIKKKKLVNYFLVVSKIIRDAKKKMLVGAGRGSSGGSLVCYLLGITQIDPIKYKLLFSRFLSISRADYPDIDIDFENNDVVKEDLFKLYGNDMACVTNYSTFQFSGLLKDLGRTYELETVDFFNKLNKRINMELEEALGIQNEESEDDFDTANYDDLIRHSTSFRDFMFTNKKIEKDLKNLLGKIRHIGKHAAGVIICDNLIEKQPTMIANEVLQTSLNEGSKERLLSDFGFVKIDILGLKTLEVIHNCLNLIGKKNGKSGIELYNEILIPEKINTEDKEVFEHIFNNFNLYGIFQFETDSMKSMIAKVKPDCFEDLVAINALFRPGPLSSGVAFEYGDRKRGYKKANYYDNKMVEEVLSSTYGVLVYQEQVMLLGERLGKLDPDDTNLLRKLLMKIKKGEKTDDKLEELKNKFFKGSIENGMEQRDLEELWQNMVNFAKYAFNRSHSVAYAMVAYQCAWLKTNHPIEFLCSLLRVESDSNYSKIIAESKNLGIEVLPLDIKISEENFSIHDGKIYFGFGNLNGVGEKATIEILKSRNNKPFENIFDFLQREDIVWQKCNKKIVETLIKVGAFGNDNIAKKLNFYAVYQDRKNHFTRDYKNQKLSELAVKWYNEQSDEEISDEQKAIYEEQFYRTNIMYSPFNSKDNIDVINIFKRSGKVGTFNEQKDCYLVKFKNIKRFNDKNGNEMCFLDLVDENGFIVQGIIFSSNYDAAKIKETLYIINGNRDNKFIIKKYDTIHELHEKVMKKKGK